MGNARKAVVSVEAYLERLGIPIMHFSHRGHFTEAIWEVVQFLDAVCQSYGKLLGQELRGSEQSTWERRRE